ncbi:hypothetical protein BDF20DRAFT_829084, partial [Mycotypha africana]
LLEKAMDEMDCVCEKRGYYIMVDIHRPTEKGYESVYLLPYSPRLNPIII